MAVMRIKQLRRAAGLSQADLGRRLGVAPGVIEAWEQETYLPRARQLPALAHALDCGIEDLFAIEKEEGRMV